MAKPIAIEKIKADSAVGNWLTKDQKATLKKIIQEAFPSSVIVIYHLKTAVVVNIDNHRICRITNEREFPQMLATIIKHCDPNRRKSNE